MKCLSCVVSFLVVLGISKGDGDSEDSINLEHFGNRIYSNPDYEIGKLVRNLAETENPEEYGSYLEGDILFPLEQHKSSMKRESLRWKNGIVPYQITGGYNNEERNLINAAIKAYHDNTCVKFVPKKAEKDFLSIENAATGCWSSVGKTGGKQVVNLQNPICVRKIGTVIHELNHAIGFIHEQNREDRDGYVNIIKANIQPGRENNFDKVPKGETVNYAEYDYGSVMHYSPTSFSKNNKPTIEAKRNTKEQMGQRESFSKKDIQKINAMYKCKRTAAFEDSAENTESTGGFGSLISSWFNKHDQPQKKNNVGNLLENQKH